MSAMVSVRERDTGQWLRNKLSGNTTWDAASISAFLTSDQLRNVAECFSTLQSCMKIKVSLMYLTVFRGKRMYIWVLYLLVIVFATLRIFSSVLLKLRLRHRTNLTGCIHVASDYMYNEICDVECILIILIPDSELRFA